MMKIFLFLISVVSLLLPLRGQGGHAALSDVNRCIGFPLLPSDGKWERAALEKKLQQSGLVFQGSLIRRSVFLHDKKIFNIPAVEFPTKTGSLLKSMLSTPIKVIPSKKANISPGISGGTADN